MARQNKKKKDDDRFRDVAQNRRAFYEYDIVERFEAGLVLQGSEVKSLRQRGASIRDAYAQVRDGEAWLIGAHIPEYEQAGMQGHDPGRTRKLLLHRREIDQIAGALAERGLSLIPIRLYFKDGRAKIELGLGRGKALHDKRRAIAEREAKREAERAIRAVSRR